MDNLDTPHHLSTRRSVIVGGLLAMTSAVGAGVNLFQRPEPPFRGALGDGIPAQIGSWHSAQLQDLVRPEERPSEKSIYDQEVSRTYEAPDKPPIMLLIAFGSTQSDTLQVHRPEFCYPASGFNIQPAAQIDIELSSASRVPSAFFTATRGERVEQVLYWTRLGDEFPSSWVAQHLAQMKNSLRGLVPNGVLVRASLIGSNESAARLQLSEFLAKLVQQSSPATKRGLVGRLASS